MSGLSADSASVVDAAASSSYVVDDGATDALIQHQELLPDLKGLLGALARFASVSKGIVPSTNDQHDDDNAVYEELQYAKSFPEFLSAFHLAQTALQDLLGETVQAITNEENDDDVMILSEPQVWEDCADACDVLTQYMEVYLERTDPRLCRFAATVRNSASSTLASIVSKTQQNLPKPQLTFVDAAAIVASTINVTVPFIPKLSTKVNGTTPLDLTPINYPNDDDDNDSQLQRQKRRKHRIGPSQYVLHPYKDEIESFQYTSQQLDRSTTKPPPIPIVEELVAEWIDTEEGLMHLVTAMRDNSVQCIAIDLEAHSYRSYAGIVCLMQLSFKDQNDGAIRNYLIDTLALRSVLQQYLADVFTDPAIVKIFHGADSDIPWLQRDFGLYIVNLFDTGRAARHLQEISQASYAYLLHHYVGITADKSSQLADWRVRPLSHELAQYAIQDTHYLLDVYEHLKYDLQSADDIQVVLDLSRQVSLIRYEAVSFDTLGYQKLLHQSKSGRGSSGKVVVSTTKPYSEHVARALYEWRDKVARDNDESIPYVATNAQLRRILSTASSMRGVSLTVMKLCNLFNPVPPLLQSNATELIQVIQTALQKDETQQQLQDEAKSTSSRSLEIQTGPSSAFFKPSPQGISGSCSGGLSSSSSLERKRRGMMSPVLGTEALYREAGWTSPAMAASGGLSARSSSEDESKMKIDVGMKPKNLLSVHANNENYKATVPKSHVLNVGAVNEDESKSQRHAPPNRLSIPAMLGLVAAVPSAGDEAPSTTAVKVPDSANRIASDEDYSEPQEFVIPRSIREIYMISNRNRRNKKTGSPTPERGVTPTSDTDRDEELSRADAVLRQEGGSEAAALFDDRSIGSNNSGGTVGTAGSPGKRARTKSASGRDSEESVPVLVGIAGGGPPGGSSINFPNTEEDINFMEEIGWVQDQADKDSLLEQRYGKRGDHSGGATASTASGMGKSASTSFGGRPGSANSTSDDMSPAASMPNPFFGSGASAPASTVATSQQRKGNQSSGVAKNRQRRERPEKKGDRSYAYRKR